MKLIELGSIGEPDVRSLINGIVKMKKVRLSRD